MLTYIIRRLALSVPSLLFISFVIFMLLNLAPGDPLSDLPVTIPPEVKAKMRDALGLNEPFHIRYIAWLHQFFIVEPKYLIGSILGTDFGSESLRAISWQSRGPVLDTILQRLPQTLWVVGLSYLFGVLIAIPIGLITAYKQYSWVDQLGTFISMVGYSVPTFFTGVLVIVIFSVNLEWFPSIYDTTLRITDFNSLLTQVRQMAMPVFVLALYNASQISRYMRASVIDNLNQDYIRTARAKGLRESSVIFSHVLRNSLIPVVTVIAIGIPNIFSGAIITESIFGVNGLGHLLITAIRANDLPMVQTLTFLFAILIVMFNLIADVMYGLLDPRIRYE